MSPLRIACSNERRTLGFPPRLCAPRPPASLGSPRLGDRLAMGPQCGETTARVPQRGTDSHAEVGRAQTRPGLVLPDVFGRNRTGVDREAGPVTKREWWFTMQRWMATVQP